MSHRLWLLLATVFLSAPAFAKETPAQSADTSPAVSVDFEVGVYERTLPEGADRAVVEAARGCDMADLDACMALGMAYVQGDGVPVNRSLGMIILRDACEQGYDTACAVERRYASN